MSVSGQHGVAELVWQPARLAAVFASEEHVQVEATWVGDLPADRRRLSGIRQDPRRADAASRDRRDQHLEPMPVGNAANLASKLSVGATLRWAVIVRSIGRVTLESGMITQRSERTAGRASFQGH